MSSTPTPPKKGEIFNSRNYFILAAIGSAVGLGNIWRFPYVAYTNGGGAFMIPYLVALLAAGIPLLFFDYAIGHRYRGSAPLALRRLGGRGTEVLGWWQVFVCFIIGIYYAAIVAWAGSYAWFSLTKAWGDDPGTFLKKDFLHAADNTAVGFDFVPQLMIPMLIVWGITLFVIARGVNKGLARMNLIAMPLLLVMFLVLVVQALFLPGAVDGLTAFFTPNWQALGDASVWAAAFSQIFFSLSVGFGIMITYSSYLKRKTDLTGSALVVGFANSSFELLAGFGVFAALGFMAHQQGVAVDDVSAGGIGLAFVAFPTIISQAPLGALMGVLFFGSLVVAGLTSMVSIIEVVVAGIRDKFELSKPVASLVVGIPMALISVAFLSTTTGLYFLDITDEFVNKLGILLGAFICLLVVAAVVGKLRTLRNHLDQHSSFKAGGWWLLVAGLIVPLVLAYILFNEIETKLAEPYGGYASDQVAIYGWGMAGLLIVLAVLVTLIPWKRTTVVDFDEDRNEHNSIDEGVTK